MDNKKKQLKSISEMNIKNLSEADDVEGDNNSDSFRYVNDDQSSTAYWPMMAIQMMVYKTNK